MNGWFPRFYLILLPLVALLFSGCVGMSNGKPPGPWHAAYEPIEDAETEVFLFQSLEKAKTQFGEPVVPVNEVLIRRSRKTDEARQYRIGEDFSLTQCIDASNGVFVIYIGVDPDHQNYYPLLGHECAHLINAKVTDWYMEGIATVFSEQVCEEAGIEWGNWKRHFSRSRKDPYGLSYHMMKELQTEFPVEYFQLNQYTVPNGKRPEWLHINIDAWLNSLSGQQQDAALDIIEPYVRVLRRQINEQYGFSVPEALQ